MRLFFALWPPRATARALLNWARTVARHSGGRPVTPKNIHLTLAFLGDANPEKAVAAAERVRGDAFELPIEIAEYWRHNQIVWAGPEQMPEPLERLVKALHLELFRAGFILERHPFAAHVTLLRKAHVPESLADLPEAPWPADEFVLVASRRLDQGVVYDPLSRFPLRP